MRMETKREGQVEEVQDRVRNFGTERDRELEIYIDIMRQRKNESENDRRIRGNRSWKLRRDLNSTVTIKKKTLQKIREIDYVISKALRGENKEEEIGYRRI